MTLIGGLLEIVLPIVYAVTVLVASRLVAGHFAYSFAEDHRRRYYVGYCFNELPEPDGAQWFGAWCAALALCSVWPLCIPALFAGRWKVGAERQAELKRLRKRTAELEREAGLR